MTAELREALQRHPDLEAAWNDCQSILLTMWYLSEVHPSLGEHDVTALLIFVGNWSEEKVSNAEQAVSAVQLELDAQVAPSAAAQLVWLLRRTWDLVQERGLVALRDLIQAEAEQDIGQWAPIGEAVERLVRGDCLRPEEVEAAGWQDPERFKRNLGAVCRVQWGHIGSTLSLIFDGVSLRDVDTRLKQQFSGAVLGREHAGQSLSPGYLGLIVDSDRRTVRRAGHHAVVDLARADIPWIIFFKMFEGGERGTTIEVLENEYPGSWSLAAKRSAIRSLKERLVALSITVPDGKHVLVELLDSEA